MANEKNLRRYAPKKLVEAAKKLWPYLGENEMAYVLIGAHWGYDKAVNEMHMKLFDMELDDKHDDNRAIQEHTRQE